MGLLVVYRSLVLNLRLHLAPVHNASICRVLAHAFDLSRELIKFSSSSVYLPFMPGSITPRNMSLGANPDKPEVNVGGRHVKLEDVLPKNQPSWWKVRHLVLLNCCLVSANHRQCQAMSVGLPCSLRVRTGLDADRESRPWQEASVC
jgi:hypothetical protein